MHTCAHLHVLWYMRKGQRTIYRDQFSPSTSWVQGLKTSYQTWWQVPLPIKLSHMPLNWAPQTVLFLLDSLLFPFLLPFLFVCLLPECSSLKLRFWPSEMLVLLESSFLSGAQDCFVCLPQAHTHECCISMLIFSVNIYIF